MITFKITNTTTEGEVNMKTIKYHLSRGKSLSTFADSIGLSSILKNELSKKKEINFTEEDDSKTTIELIEDVGGKLLLGAE